MTPNFFENYNQILYNCEKPSRYIGGEFLSANKDFDAAKVTVALAFPDKYEIGISNFGHKILYNILNESADFLADRVYAPEMDFVKLLEAQKRELYALDTKNPLKTFDFIGFALQYELSYTTILKMLDLAGINVFSAERNEDDPIILAGGPCAYNPVPMSQFIDLFLIGDGEEVILELCEKYKTLRTKGVKRAQIIKELSEIEGVFCPIHPHATKKRTAPLKIETSPVKSPIPHFASVHDRATVEIRRGCARLCRFCQSAHTNLPIRERGREEVEKLVKAYVQNTGYDEYSLLSLSSNDHSEIETIIENLNAHFKGTDVNVSLPSQRADKFSVKLANLMQEVKKSTVTLAPEAGSQRLRDIIKKGLTQEQIVDATLASVKNGWQKIKYYFMVGLPFEEKPDLDAMVKLFEAVNNACHAEGLKKPQINCSVSIFVPKPFTPFCRCAQNSLETVFEKIAYLRNGVKHLKNVRLSFHEPRVSQIEAYLTRGGKDVGEVIYKLYKNGAYLESWSENFSYERYLELVPDVEKIATREIGANEQLPWGLIDCGLDASYFEKEFNLAAETAKVSV